MKKKLRKKRKLRVPLGTRPPKIQAPKTIYSRKKKHKHNP